ncbi:hypothetical protein CDD82_7890 [Ophiocordyceps australis]|uniref:ATP-grasp domain-containing protein n=1 Tax=Ophiocordyceps australis TaxID=1399860 RepID=A0A2C5ZQT4_9HYPO|nr:hypothetical protein CDD82_7890 [Ophiocordyceps australis]
MAGSCLWHLVKNGLLLALSLVLLPLSTAAIAAISLWASLAIGSKRKEPPWPKPKTILVTGVSMSKGLTLARLFHQRGHRVIGADFHALALGRVSCAIDRFCALPRPALGQDDDVDEDDDYVLGLLRLVKEEGVDLWLSVSDVTAALHDAVAKEVIETQTLAKAVQLSLAHVKMLHEKDSFMQHCKSLGLPLPDTLVVNSSSAIVQHLTDNGGLQHHAEKSHYLVKPIGVNDVARFSMPLLPLVSEQETLWRIEAIPFGEKPAYILQEFIDGPEFCTHALVIKGQVRAFVACPSSDLLVHYTALPPESPLSHKMLAFTQTMAQAAGEQWTGHVSFDFLAKAAEKGADADVYPIECNPRVHTAIVLFNDTPALVDEYLAVLDPAWSTADGAEKGADKGPLYPRNPQQYYWVGQDLVEGVLCPMMEMLVFKTTSRAQFRRSLRCFINRLRQWKDGTFELWDPWPWWWLYHIYWPVQFLGYMMRRRWQRINVSTGKAFQAE